MLDKRQYNDNILYHDMPLEDQHEWFGYSRNKFLHNIDTFYYSVRQRKSAKQPVAVSSLSRIFWEVTAVPDDLIKKSIRLPADLDAYVDQQKGTTWTDKLCRILEDYRSGEETRAERMAYYENWIKASQKKIDEQNRQIYTVARALDHLHRAMDDLNNLPFT